MRIGIITGASSGLGLAFAACQRKYFKLEELWVLGRSQARMEDALGPVAQTPLRFFEMDLSKEDWSPLERALEEEKPELVYLINCAGYGKQGTLRSLSWPELLQSHQLNTTALLRMTKLCFPYLKRGSLVLQVASSAAFLPQAGFAQYAAGKRFVLDFARALRAEWKTWGIKVAALCPNPMDTGFALSERKDLISRLKRRVQERPEEVAPKALEQALKGRAVITTSGFARAFYLCACLMPSSLILWLEAKSLRDENSFLRKDGP